LITNDTRLLSMRLNDQTGQNAIACHELADLTKDLAAKPLLGLQGEDVLEKSDSAIDQKKCDQLDRVSSADSDKLLEKGAKRRNPSRNS